MTNDEASRLVRTLIDAFPQVELRARTEEIYVRWLADLDRGHAEEAIDLLIGSSMTLPTIGEIRRLVVEHQFGIPTAEEAWVSVNDRDVEIHDLTREVVRSFGGSFNIRTAEEPGIMRAQFLKAFDATRERYMRDANSASYRGRRDARAA